MTARLLLLLAEAETPATEKVVEATSMWTDLAEVVPLLTIFILAVFIGFEIITKIPPTLHTPLMSGSNAISGIAVIGAILSLKSDYPGVAQFLGFVAIVLAMINVVGGFLVTNRMLGMFRKKD